MVLSRRLTAIGLLPVLVLLVTAPVMAAPPASQPAADSQPAEAAERFIPVAYCPRTDTPPTLDGSPDDACWAYAGLLTAFVSDRSETLVGQQTEVRLLHDDEWIYMAVRCRETDMDHPVRKTGRMWEDEDSVEIFLDARRGDNEFAHYGINTLGATDLPRPKGQPADTVARVVAQSDGWTIQARIRIKALAGVPPRRARLGA